MTPTVTLTLPAAWLRGATSCALYPMAGVQVLDIISFDLIDGQPVLRYPPAELAQANRKETPMLKLQPDARTWPERLAVQRETFAAALADLGLLAAALAERDDLPEPGAPRSTALHLRDVRLSLSRLIDMTRQAQREHRRGDIGSATDTLTACYALIGGELALRLRVWRASETDPTLTAALDAWLIVLDHLEDPEVRA